MEELPQLPAWPLDNFPEPNPYFPGRPRWSARLPLFMALCLVIGAGYVIYRSFANPEALPWSLHYWAVPAAGGIGTIALFRLPHAYRRLAWFNGAIVPAEVVWPPAGSMPRPNPKITWRVVVRGLLPFPVNMIGAVLLHREEDEPEPTGPAGPYGVTRGDDRMEVLYVHEGETHELVVRTCGKWKRFNRGDVFWLCWNPRGRSYPVAVCGGWQSSRAVPNSNVLDWLEQAKVQAEKLRLTPGGLRAYRQRLRIEKETAPDLHEAAKANTRAMKRAGRG